MVTRKQVNSWCAWHDICNKLHGTRANFIYINTNFILENTIYDTNSISAWNVVDNKDEYLDLQNRKNVLDRYNRTNYERKVPYPTADSNPGLLLLDVASVSTVTINLANKRLKNTHRLFDDNLSNISNL